MSFFKKKEDINTAYTADTVHDTDFGTAEDVEFHKLRLSMFLNDSIIFVIEHGLTKKRLFIL